MQMQINHKNTEGASVNGAVTRRSFLAVGAAATVPAVATAKSEHPWEKVRHLADQLADALYETDGGRWFATIYPPGSHDYSIMFGDIQAQERMQYFVAPEMPEMIARHRKAVDKFGDACDGVDNVIVGSKPSKAAVRRYNSTCRAEEDAFLAICGYRPKNDATRHAKAAYLLEYTKHSQLNHIQVEALLNSMLGRK